MQKCNCCNCYDGIGGNFMKKETEADSTDITEYQRHHKQRPYLCTVCHKRFKTKSYLNVHSKRHKGEKLWYSCTYCEKRFTDQYYLSTHMNVHSSKYKCIECAKCFHNNHLLAVHRRIHSGEKPFECTVCSKGFTISGSLVRHS